MKNLENGIEKTILLKDGPIGVHHGRGVDVFSRLLRRCDKGEGVIFSEADILGYVPDLIDDYWHSSTQLATNIEGVKIILPYANGSGILTDAARFGLGLIDADKMLVDGGVSLDIGDRWERYCEWGEIDGVYDFRRADLDVGREFNEAGALKNPVILIKWGHPDYVDSEFARSADEVEGKISKIFEYGRDEFGHEKMMGQYLPKVSVNAVLNTWFVSSLEDGAASSGRASLRCDGGRFIFRAN